MIYDDNQESKLNIMGRAGSFRSNPNIVSRFDRGIDPRGDLI
jgi:hypothetical protein